MFIKLFAGYVHSFCTISTKVNGRNGGGGGGEGAIVLALNNEQKLVP